MFLDIAEFILDWGFSAAVLLLHYSCKVLIPRKLLLALSAMAISSTARPCTPPAASPPLPWKRCAPTELPPASPAKRSRECSARPVDVVLAPRGWDVVREAMLVEGADGAPAKSPTGDGKGVAMGDRKVRRRPPMIVVPVASSFVPELENERKKKKDSAGRDFAVEGDGYCLASRRGDYRVVMEDGYQAMTGINGDSKQAYFGVFDGHGGRAAVDFVSEKLGKNIETALHEVGKGENLAEVAIRAGYLTTDRDFLSQNLGSGVCAATVLLKNGELHAANVGDCRVVISRKGVAHALTRDHRAGREDERRRIESTGGYVNCHNGIWRVQDSLSISRAIGDLHMKEWIISEPEISKIRLSSDCDFLIMASDGLWDKVSEQEAVDVVLRGHSFLESCKTLVELSSSRGSRDDITIMVIPLQKFV